MTLNAEIKFIKQPQVGDYIEFDLKSDGISSIGTPVKIVFNNTATSTTLGESKIGSNIENTVTTLLNKLSTYYDTTNDGNFILYTKSFDTIKIVYNTSVGNNGYSTFYFNSVPSIGTLVEVKQYIASTTFSPSGFLPSNSPYFVIYENTNDYDKINLDLTIWSGSLSDKPLEPSYQFSKYKTSYTDTITSINIAHIIRSFLNPQLNNKWITGTTINGGFDETCYVSWTCYGLKDILDVNGNYNGESILISSITDGKIATLGYGYFEDGSNPVITNPLTTQTNYITFGDNEFTTIGVLTGTTSDNTIIRTKISDRGICERVNKNYQVVYLNKNGVFTGFSFPKLSKKTITSKTDKFERLLKSPYNYSPFQHSTKVLNKTENKTFILNTNSLKESDVNHIQELILSEKHYLIVDEKIIPVVLKDSDFEIKNNINNRARIQYQLEFQSANEVKNNIQ